MSERIPLCVPRLDGKEDAYLQECVRSGFVSSVGPFVERFEQLVAAAAGTPKAVATASGTAALHLALMAAGVQRDELVIVPGFTFIGTANAVAHCGAMPWILDVAESTWTLDPDLLEHCLNTETRSASGQRVHVASGRRVGAIVPVYAMGEPAEMERIGAIARAYGLPVIADAEGAMGAEFLGQPLGAWADLTIFSFNGNKTITAGGGGAVVSHDLERLAAIRHRSTQARVGREYHHDSVGYNYRMTNLQAAVGCAQIERLELFVQIKRAIRDRYDRAFAGDETLRPFPRNVRGRGSAWYSGVQLGQGGAAVVKQLCAGLESAGIEARGFWKPLNHQPPFAAAPASLNGVGDRFWTNVLTLPCSTGLKEEDQDRVISALRLALSRLSAPALSA